MTSGMNPTPDNHGHGGDAAVTFTRRVLGHYKHAWCIDFEYEAQHHVIPKPVVMVARDVLSGRVIRLGPDFLANCPFACDGTEIFIAFYAVAEGSCFQALGWPMPPHWLDLWVEAKRLRNGQVDQRSGLLEVMGRYGLAMRDSVHKKAMQELVGGEHWSQTDLPAILDYCEADVDDTAALLHRMLPEILTEAPQADAAMALAQAIIRGTFMAENARMERAGLPVDVPAWELVRERWPAIRSTLITTVDASYGVFNGDSFNSALFADFLRRERIPWPRLPSGALAMDDDTFRSRAKAEPRVADLRELRVSLSQMRSNSIIVDSDGRTRTSLRPFTSKTGRSQPSTSAYLFGSAKWVRSFLRAPEGHVFAYLDFSSEELAIGAYLSGDANLAEAYAGGDPYIGFAIQAGLAPKGATKKSHPTERAACKTLVLGVGYGMSAVSMSDQSGVDLATCTELLQRHKETYRQYWQFVQTYRDRIAGGQAAYTPLGWRIQLGIGAEVNDRSAGNWPAQSTGSDVLRLSVLFCIQAGVVPIATVHDALCFCVPAGQADELLATAKHQMERAAMAATGGPIRVDVTRYDASEVYRDEVGFEFYNKVMELAHAA